LALEPDHAGALNGLGQAYYFTRQWDKAEQYLLKAAPNAPAAWWGLTNLYLLQGKWDQAQQYAQKIVDAGGADARPLLDAAKNKQLPEELRRQIEPPTTP
jgi:tetratricopeptide (TPR) repeat protein